MDFTQDVTRFNEQLNALLSKNSVEQNDFLAFIKTVAALSKEIQDARKMQVYGLVVKEWISAFQKIFGKHKTDKEMKTYMNRLSSTMTELYLKMSLIFHQYERDYTQQFYWQWKRMISVISKRASNFIKHMDQFKNTVTHLRTAQLRCEQLAILDVLNLYIEEVPQSELDKFKKLVIADDVDIIDGLIQLKQQPSSIHKHAFLHRINSMGNNISSFQPTKIICANLALEYTKPKFEMWIDFNLKDKSIMFVAQPSTNDANQCIAIVPDPKLKQCVINGEQLLIVKGFWSICTVPEVGQLGQKFIVTIFFSIRVFNMILESQVSSVFKIKSNRNFCSGETSSVDFDSKKMNSKWRNNPNVFLHPPTYFNDEIISEEQSGRSRLPESLESSILLLSSDQSVLEWKKSSCERLSADGWSILQETDLEDGLVRDNAKTECIKDTAANLKTVQTNQKISTNQARKKDAEITKDPSVKHQALGDEFQRVDMPLCDMSVHESDMNDKFENLIKKDHLAGGLVCDVKAENIKDTVTEEKTVEENEKSLTNQRRNKDDQITKSPLALDDDYKSSGVSGKDYFVSVNICSVPQKPIIKKKAPLRNRNENIKVCDMPNALQQLGIDYDSSESFCDNESVKETYDTFENSIKNYHLTDNERMLTSTPRRNFDTNVKTSRASSFNERNESNLKLAENSLNANQLPKIDNTQYIQPSLNVASDKMSIVAENHFVHSNLVESHYRNEKGYADSSFISPPLIHQTVAINASKPTETFPNRDVSELVQNTVIDIATKTVEYEFANDEELQKASRFYIDNSGLDYLNSANFKRLNRRQQKTIEQQLRAIHDMKNRGLEALHQNRNAHDTDPYDFVLPHPPVSKRKSNVKQIPENKLNWPSDSSSMSNQNSEKTATKKVAFEFPTRNSDERNKSMTKTPRRIRNISLLFEDETAPKLKTSKNVDKSMTAPKSEVNRNKNKRPKASNTQKFTINNELADSTAVGKENARSSLSNYRGKKPKIEILSVVDLGVVHLGVVHQSSEKMDQHDDQQVFCNAPSCNALLNNLSKFTLLSGACKQHENQLA